MRAEADKRTEKASNYRKAYIVWYTRQQKRTVSVTTHSGMKRRRIDIGILWGLTKPNNTKQKRRLQNGLFFLRLLDILHDIDLFEKSLKKFKLPAWRVATILPNHSINFADPGQKRRVSSIISDSIAGWTQFWRISCTLYPRTDAQNLVSL